jgi:hypothetical protein
MMFLPCTECGFVEQILITNDHFVALTDKGVYVSASLNTSESNVGAEYEEKPLLSYRLLDPCANFEAYISCFKVRKNKINKLGQRLF